MEPNQRNQVGADFEYRAAVWQSRKLRERAEHNGTHMHTTKQKIPTHKTPRMQRRHVRLMRLHLERSGPKELGYKRRAIPVPPTPSRSFVTVLHLQRREASLRASSSRLLLLTARDCAATHGSGRTPRASCRVGNSRGHDRGDAHPSLRRSA